MYIFSFSIPIEAPIHISSARVVYLLVLPSFLLNRKWQSNSLKVIKNKKIVTIIILLIFIISYTLFVPIFYKTYDYSMLSPFINQMIALIFGIIIFSLFKLKRKVNDIPKYLIYIFIIQALIQFFSFVSPEIRNFLNLFRVEDKILIAERYNYIRGLAISGGQFFGLAVGFGLIFIIYSYFWYDVFKKASVLKYLSLIFLFFGAMSAARSSLVGVGISIFYFVINKIKNMELKFNRRLKINIINIVLIIILIFTILLTIYLIDFDFIIDKIQRMSKFAFEFIYNFINKGELSTSSTDILFNRMYFKVDLKTFFIGDGLYTNPDGSYYMHTDAGYMRNILYFGIVGFIILLIYQLQFFVWRKKKFFLFNVLVMFYILVLHIKGYTLSFNIMMQKILFLLLLYNIYITSKRSVRTKYSL